MPQHLSPQPTLVLNDMVRADRFALAQLHLSSWRDAYGGDLPRASLEHLAPTYLSGRWQAHALRPDRPVWVARDMPTGPILGFLAAQDGPISLVDALHVAPRARNRGVGGALLAHALDAFAARRRIGAELWVTERNASARRFYARFGASEAERAPITLLGHPVPALRMVWRNLPDAPRP